jgi:thiol-disulfide isomerase/thioredoxin
MFKHLIFLCCLFTAYQSSAQTVSIVKFDALQKIITSNNDTTYVINFWATWCKPCVHELPGFVKIDSMYKNEKVKVLLVSLDFVKDTKTRLEPFLKQKKIATTVWLLNEPDYNSWIDKVDPEWGGSLPTTFIYKNHKHLLLEYELGFAELNKELLNFKSISIKE